MTVLDYLNKKFEHPNTIVFDNTSMTYMVLIVLTFLLVIIGFLKFLPIGVISLVILILLCYFAWKDFGKYMVEAIRYKYGAKSNRENH